MQFSILVTAPPQGPGAVTALRTLAAVRRSEHHLHCVFLYGEGVHLASRLTAGDGESTRAQRQWQALVADSGMVVQVCSGAAQRRGIVDDTEAARARPDGGNLAPGFRLTGLGDWVDALARSDRVIHFG